MTTREKMIEKAVNCYLNYWSTNEEDLDTPMVEGEDFEVRRWESMNAPFHGFFCCLAWYNGVREFCIFDEDGEVSSCYIDTMELIN